MSHRGWIFFLFWVFVCHFILFVICLFFLSGVSFLLYSPSQCNSDRCLSYACFFSFKLSFLLLNLFFCRSICNLSNLGSLSFQAFASCFSFMSAVDQSILQLPCLIWFISFSGTFFSSLATRPRTSILAVYMVQHPNFPLILLSSFCFEASASFLRLRRAVIQWMLLLVYFVSSPILCTSFFFHCLHTRGHITSLSLWCTSFPISTLSTKDLLLPARSCLIFFIYLAFIM